MSDQKNKPVRSPRRRSTAANVSDGIDDALYRAFIENLPVMFYAVTPTKPHRPLYVSPSFQRFGYPLSDWMTKPNIWDRVIHPDDRSTVLSETRAALEEGRNVDFEYRVVCRDGHVLWVRDRSCFIRREDGEPLCWQGVILDITDRKQAEIELQKREKLYRTLAKTIPDTAVLLFDSDYRYTLADGEQLRKHGWCQAMFEDRTLWEVFPGEMAEEWAIYYQRALAGEDVRIERETSEGAFEVSLRPVRDENGDIFAGMVMWQDITERKRAETALRDSEARYRQLFENANDIIYVHDLEGRYISINQAAERIFGYTREEAMALNIKDVAAPEHLPLVMRNFERKLAGEAHQTVYEVDCIRKDGTIATLEVNSSLVHKDGVPVAVQGIARDITDRKAAQEEIRKSEERYRDLFENANDLIYTHDLQGNFTSLNRAGELITGYSREEALTMNLSQVVAPEFLTAAREMTARKVAGEKPSTYELEIIAKSGERVLLELSTRLIFADGKPVGIQGIARDITARRHAEMSMQNAISLLASTFESTADGIVVLGRNDELVTCNRRFREMWKFDEPSIDSKNGKDLLKRIAQLMREPDKFSRVMSVLRKDPLATDSLTFELMDGRIYEFYSQPQYMGNEPVGRVCCFRDITERNRAEEQLRHYALHDPLTNLPNRVQFMEHLHHAVARADSNAHAQFAVLFLDLDRFKVINDSLGHGVGDKLLVAIAERLTSCVRPGDVVARLGGDEFTILLHRSGDTRDVARVADRLQKTIAVPFKIDNYEVFTSASIGIVVSGDVERRAEDFLRDADAAMYRAKEGGKARYEIFDAEMHVLNMNLLQVETDLRHAVDRREFEVLYQPIVDLDTGSVTEFEALIRWRHPVHGLVAPNEFVNVAEETGLIIPIGRWILEQACLQVASWQKQFGTPFSVSVNLSAKQLMHPNLIPQVRDILRSSGITSGQLKLEVTESTVMEHSERSLRVLVELHKLGVGLSTDDFGTGYSSLSYLQKFPFERLKIDRSFTDTLDKDEKSASIVKTILMLGQNLAIEVVAEGVETLSQLERLRHYGCRQGQGYLFSRPVDSETATQFLKGGANVFSADAGLEFAGLTTTIEVSELQ
jgi:diguanylate cyclase (GGDEF)-like protein/PAS domain S-box-containing protein